VQKQHVSSEQPHTATGRSSLWKTSKTKRTILTRYVQVKDADVVIALHTAASKEGAEKRTTIRENCFIFSELVSPRIPGFHRQTSHSTNFSLIKMGEMRACTRPCLPSTCACFLVALITNIASTCTTTSCKINTRNVRTQSTYVDSAACTDG
jgi:hypothetical protein